MIYRMEMEIFIQLMEHITKVNGLMARKKEKEITDFLIVITMKANGRMTKLWGWGNFYTETEINIKGNVLLVYEMGKASISTKMEVTMMGSGKKV